jgi:hypothetical protein
MFNYTYFLDPLIITSISFFTLVISIFIFLELDRVNKLKNPIGEIGIIADN